MKSNQKKKSVVKPKSEMKLPYYFSWSSFMKYYKDADDRVTAIVLASMLEEHTQDYLSEMCKHDPPPFHASQRIELLYSLGWLPEYIYGDLKLIALIRNKFAHNFDVNSFEMPQVKPLVLRLVIPKDNHEVEPLMPGNLTELKRSFVKSAIVCQAIMDADIRKEREEKKK